MSKESSSVFEIYSERVNQITEALEILSKHFKVEIKRDIVVNNQCNDVYRDADSLINGFLKEYYKDHPYITVKIS